MNTIYLVVKKYKWYIIAWFLLNIFQATFTNLHYDEAYYWIYSKILSWGYFDHPPMVSITTKLGDLISHSTLGIRTISILMGTIVLIGILKLIDNKKTKLTPSFLLSHSLLYHHILLDFLHYLMPHYAFFLYYFYLLIKNIFLMNQKLMLLFFL